MLVKSEVSKRIFTLSSYIEQLSENISNKNLVKGAFLIKENKNTIYNTLLSKYQPENQIVDVLQYNNLKLTAQIQRLTKIKKEKEAYLAKERGFNAGITKQQVKISNLRIKITINDVNKIDYENGSIQGNFTQIKVYYSNLVKTIELSNIINIQIKSHFILLQYRNGQEINYMVIELQTQERAKRLGRGLKFGKLIADSKKRKRLFEAIKVVNAIETVQNGGEQHQNKQISNENGKQQIQDDEKNNQEHEFQILINNQNSKIHNPMINSNKVSSINQLNNNAYSNRFRGLTNSIGISQINLSSGPKHNRKASWDFNMRKNSSLSPKDMYLVNNMSSRQSDFEFSSPSPVQSYSPRDQRVVVISPKIQNKLKEKQILLQSVMNNKKIEEYQARPIEYIKEDTNQNKSKSNESFGNQLASQQSSQKMAVNYHLARSITTNPNFQTPFPSLERLMKQDTIQSDYISEKSEQLQVSSPTFPKKVDYTSKGQLKLTPVNMSKNMSYSHDNIFTEETKNYHNNEDDQDEDDDQEEQQQNKQQTFSNNTNEVQLLQQRLNELKKGIVLTKCSVDGFSPHQKRVYLSSNEKQLNYQDIGSNKLKSVNITDIKSISYKKRGNGIIKHMKNVQDAKCMTITLKPTKQNKDKQKTLQFVGDISDILQKYANNLSLFTQAVQSGR